MVTYCKINDDKLSCMTLRHPILSSIMKLVIFHFPTSNQ